ncbi:MAG: flagellar export protein FliJ [Planctomycetes bacterium]|nr:flagellar export protein FliJ [Planctomycetota bacterium]
MAKAFTFRVEPVLKVRQQTERLALQRLADAQRQVSEVEDAIAGLRGQLADQDRLVRQGVLTGSVDVNYMSLYRRHVMALHRRMIEQAHRLHEATVRLAARREEAAAAMKQRKVLQTLKDKLKARYLDDLERTEARTQDDLTLMRVGHQRIEEDA